MQELLCMQSRAVLESWVASQIWLHADSTKSSRSWVGRENRGGFVLNQSRMKVTLFYSELGEMDTAWVKVQLLIILKIKR